MKIQKRLKHRNPRKKLSGYMIKETNRAVTDAAREFNCSKSFIIAVALAKFFGIKNQERYY